jgi:hypothetical protein
MEHKVGDTVRIQSQEWIDAEGKDGGRAIAVDSVVFNGEMQCHAGRMAKVTGIRHGRYTLDVDGGEWEWEDWMLDSDYRPEDEPLSVEDALRAMLDGETLYDEHDRPFLLNGAEKRIEYVDSDDESGDESVHVHNMFTWVLHRRPAKRSRDMTRWEILAWVNSEESRGWLVMYTGSGDWSPPQYYNYADLPGQYQRARLLPDCSGIDEDTIQGFEVEE